VFFFEKKNQKTFDNMLRLGELIKMTCRANTKLQSFFGSFCSQKEHFPSPFLAYGF